jgi:hypothetical protein
MSADGIKDTATPILPVSSLTTTPSVTVPLVGGRQVNARPIWDYLRSPAEFFEIPLPGVDDLSAALGDFCAAAEHASGVIAATVSLVSVGAQPHFVVTGTVVEAFEADPVAIHVDENMLRFASRPADPQWKQMADRTTARAQLDQIQRWLTDHGYADAVQTLGGRSVGAPLLGALVFEVGSELVGLEHSDSADSILYGLMRCGAVLPDAIGRGQRSIDPRHVDRSWWISPNFETHPVSAIGDVRLDATPVPHPPFLAQ